MSPRGASKPDVAAAADRADLAHDPHQLASHQVTLIKTIRRHGIRDRVKDWLSKSEYSAG